MWRVYKHTGNDKDYEAYKEALYILTQQQTKLESLSEMLSTKLAQHIRSDSKSFYAYVRGAVAGWVRALACTGDRTVLAGFESHGGKLRFGTLAIPFTPLCQCLSEETLKAVTPFYLVSMPEEVKDPTSPHWNV